MSIPKFKPMPGRVLAKSTGRPIAAGAITLEGTSLNEAIAVAVGDECHPMIRRGSIIVYMRTLGGPITLDNGEGQPEEYVIIRNADIDLVETTYASPSEPELSICRD